jgi:hypothetical protein
MDFNKGESDTKDMINAGAEITGGAIAGGASGFLLGGPAGALAGSVAGGSAPLLKRGIIGIVGDIAERFLSERERIRIGGVVNYASHKIQEKMNAGEELRNDDFFQVPPIRQLACSEIPFIERPASQEVLEGILLAAQREFEEKKIPFLGNLLANIAFDDKIGKLQANHLIRLATDVSYRQMCLLSLFAQSKDFDLRNKAYIGENLSTDTYTLLQEIYEMISLGLLTIPQRTFRSIADISPREMKAVGIGYLVYNMMELKDIDRKDLNQLAQLLQ